IRLIRSEIATLVDESPLASDSPARSMRFASSREVLGRSDLELRDTAFIYADEIDGMIAGESSDKAKGFAGTPAMRGRVVMDDGSDAALLPRDHTGTCESAARPFCTAMGQSTIDLPDPTDTQPESAASADDLLSQLAGDEIDRLLAEADDGASMTVPEA